MTSTSTATSFQLQQQHPLSVTNTNDNDSDNNNYKHNTTIIGIDGRRRSTTNMNADNMTNNISTSTTTNRHQTILYDQNSSLSSDIPDSISKNRIDSTTNLSTITGKTTPNVMRVRVINQQSQRSKDLLVDIPQEADEDEFEEHDDDSDVEDDDHDMKTAQMGTKLKNRTAITTSTTTKTATVYDAIYDHPAVKKAHVRKWGQDVVRKIKQQEQQQQTAGSDNNNRKNGFAEIQCAVWDDVVDQPLHTFTIDEIKTMTTRHLYRLVPESDMIKFVLMFVEYREDDGDNHDGSDDDDENDGQPKPTEDQQQGQDNADGGGNIRENGPFRRVEGLSGQLSSQAIRSSPPSNEHYPSVTPFSAKALLSSPSSSGVFRCPFSGAIVDESLVREIEEHVQEQRSSASEGNSKSGNYKSMAPPSTNTTAASTSKNNNNNVHRPYHHQRHKLQSPINGMSSVSEPLSTSSHKSADYGNGNGSYVSTANTNSTPRSLHTLDSIPDANSRCGEDNCDDDDNDDVFRVDDSSHGISPGGRQGFRQDESTLGTGTTQSNHIHPGSAFGEESSIMSASDYHSQQLMQMEMKSTMRIRISNKSSKRSKDLVVDIKSDLNVYDAVYDNPGVKNAHVRKWGSDVVKDVKRKSAEIKCLVILGGDTDDDGYVSRSFSIEDLKSTSTLDLFELAPDSDPLQLVLQCVKKKSLVDRVSKRWTMDVSTRIPMRLEKGKPQALAPTLASSKSDPSILLGLSGKRPPRPNHMNLSAMRNATFASTSATQTAVASKLFSYKNTTASAKVQSEAAPEQEVIKPTADENVAAVVLSPVKDCVSAARANDKTVLSRNIAASPPMDFSALQPLQRKRSVSAPSPSINSLMNNQPGDEFIDPFAESDSSQLEFIPLKTDMTPVTTEDGGEKKTNSITLRQELKDHQNEPRTAWNDSVHEEQIKEFIRLCRSKKSPEQFSGNDLRHLDKHSLGEPMNGAPNATFHTNPEDCPSVEFRSRNRFESKQREAPRKSHSAIVGQQLGGIAREFTDRIVVNAEPNAPSSSRIDRFLEFSRGPRRPNQADTDWTRGHVPFGVPPVAEIAVVTGPRALAPPPAPTPASAAGISLSSDQVNEVFPYNIIIDESFTILQVGNSLSMLVDEENLLGRTVSDIMTITGPIPMFGTWNWKTMDKMKDKTVFLESVVPGSSGEKAKIKGTMIELSREPRQVMLVLFPNVKNLAELEQMNLSMADLPLHSCQREAVLLGEHSKSEVKLTNHLDHLHRDLINSMERQIEDRTNELALANRELEEANARLAVQSARQLEHFACMSHEIRTPRKCPFSLSLCDTLMAFLNSYPFFCYLCCQWQ
jgi:Heme NO binding associated